MVFRMGSLNYQQTSGWEQESATLPHFQAAGRGPRGRWTLEKREKIHVSEKNC